MNKRIFLYILYSGFITIGLVSSIFGALLPSINNDIKMNYIESGFFLSGLFFGVSFIVIISFFMIDKFDRKIILFMGSFIILSGLFICSIAARYTVLLAGTIITGIGFGIYEVLINALCIDYCTEYCNDKKASIINFLHFFFGIGAISGPLLATFSVKILNNWRFTFLLIILLPLSIIFFLFKIKFHFKNILIEDKKDLKILAMPFFYIAGLSAFIYVGIEVSIYGWLPTYWDKLNLFNLIPPALTATIFWIFLTIGRLFLGRIIDKIGFKKYLIFSAMIVIIISLLWSFLQLSLTTIILTALTGFIFSCIFPSILGYTTSNYPDHSGVITSFITIFASIGGFVIPSLTGKIADYFSIKILPVIIVLLSVLFLLNNILSIVFKNMRIKFLNKNPD